MCEGSRLVRRWIRPNGVLVAVLGPDGAGKTTLIKNLRKEFSPAFWGARQFHTRPQVLASKADAPAVTNPHGKRPRGALLSSVYLVGMMVDYWIGYVLVLRQLKSRSCFLVFDRYFHDVLVDPLRFRYGGTRWLSSFLCRFVPLPDLIFVLDANEDALLTRKTEVPRDELRRQREAYRRLHLDRSRICLIQTESGIDTVRHQASQALVDLMSRRFSQLRPDWLDSAS
jgi:thymidylate kinase